MAEIKGVKDFQKADAYILGIFDDAKPLATPFDEKINEMLGNQVLDLLEAKKLKARKKDVSKIYTRKKDNLPFSVVVVSGLGERKKLDAGTVAECMGYGMQALIDEAVSVQTSLTALPGLDAKGKTGAVVEGAFLGHYRAVHKKEALKELKYLWLLGEVDLDAVKTAEAIVEGVKLTRMLANEPPDTIYPETLGEAAKKYLKHPQIKVDVHDIKWMQKERMNASLAVGRGSVHPPVFIEVHYKPKGKALKKIALVGKGVTFDSGGYALKPAEMMVDMYGDKSGACAMLGIIKTAALLNLPFEILGCSAVVENRIGGQAYLNGSVVVHRNGKTCLVKNTDAEGRMTLSDSLNYADEWKPDLMYDFATLTGACIVAAGEFEIGLFTREHQNDLVKPIEEASQRTNEEVHHFPVKERHIKIMDGKRTDLANISDDKYEGHRTAAGFLTNFVSQDTKWVHWDIAGPALNVKGLNGLCPTDCFTGVPNRTVIEVLRRMAQ